MLRHDVQLVLPQSRQQVLGQDQGVDIGGPEVQPRLGAALADEADVELRVVGRQGPPVDELQEVRQGLLGRGRVLEHLVGDARKADDLRRQPPPGVHEGLEALGNLSVPEDHRADLRDGLPVHPEARGLDVEADDLPVQGDVLGPVDGDPVVHVVDEIALHPVEDLDLVPGGVPGVGEGLGHAVVRDGDGGVAPADGLLDDLLGVRQGVHVAHLGVEVELHPLHRGGVLPLLMVRRVDALGVQLNVLAVPGGLHLPLDRQPHAGLHGPLQGLGLLGRQVFLDGDGPRAVGHVEAEPPEPRPPGLPALKKEDLAGDGGLSHFDVQLRHGHGPGLHRLAHQHLPRLLRRLCLGNGLRRRRRRRRTDGLDLRPGEAVDRFQRLLQAPELLRLQGDLHRHIQLNRPLPLVDAAMGQLRPGQPEAELRGRRELGEQFKKWDVFRHGILSSPNSASLAPAAKGQIDQRSRQRDQPQAVQSRGIGR